MSKKRKAKKELTKHQRLSDELDELYRRKDWPGLVRLAQERLTDPAASEHAPRFLEALDLALREAMSRGELDAAARIARNTIGTASRQPLVQIGRAVADLSAGRTARAAERLAPLAADLPETSDGSASAGQHGTPPDLQRAARRLLRLCEPAGPEAKDERSVRITRGVAVLRDVDRLTTTLQRLSDSGPARSMPPRSIGLILPEAQAVWDLARALAAIAGKGYRPTGHQLRPLRKLPQWIWRPGFRQGALPFEAIPETIEGLQRLIRILETSPDDTPQRIAEKISTWLGYARRLLDRDVGSSPLRHLQHTLRIARHDLIAAISSRMPRMFEEMVNRGVIADEMLQAPSTPPAMPPRLVEQQQARMTWRRRALGLLDKLESDDGTEDEGHRWAMLLNMIDQEASRETDPGRLVVLWAVRFRVAQRWAFAEGMLHWDDSGFNPHRDVIMPLLSMTEGFREVIPPERQLVVAKALRTHLLQIIQVAEACDHVAEAALNLLETLKDDVALLVLAMAAAIAYDDDELSDRVRRHIEELGGSAPVDTDELGMLLESLVHDHDISTLTAVVEILGSLLSDAQWRACLEPPARLLAEQMVNSSSLALSTSRDKEVRDEELADALSTAYGVWLEQPVVQAAVAAIECMLASRQTEITAHIEQLQSAFPGLGPSVDLFVNLDQLADSLPKSRIQHKALHSLAEWIIDHMDADWRVWLRAIEPLSMTKLDAQHMQQLMMILEEAANDPSLPPHQSYLILDAVRSIRVQMLSFLSRSFERSTRRRRGPAPKPTGRKARGRKKSEPEPEPEEDTHQSSFDFGWE